MDIKKEIEKGLGKSIRECDDMELYLSLAELVNRLAIDDTQTVSGKKLYYISAEFLIGKMLSNNLINLGIYEDVKEILARNGKDLSKIEDMEQEPSLGNGGLGRLAACYIDSMASLGVNGDGVGLLYHFGLFRQKFKDNAQIEEPDRWDRNRKILIPTKTCFDVEICGKRVKSSMFDVCITGYGTGSRRLHLFDLEGADETLVKDGIDFDKKQIEKNLTLFLYPDDSDEDGRMLRICQQYFMVSSAAQLILAECEENGGDVGCLQDYAVVQINDTHPAMIIPELIRLLVERGLEIQKAIETVRRTCAYTNHTILAEALEKWPRKYLEKAVPQLMPIIDMLDRDVKKKYTDKKVHIIDESGLVHMANMAIHFGFCINGVAGLHTDILKNEELSGFSAIYPEKFTNKTNGVSMRRWLIAANPELVAFIEKLIGADFRRDFQRLEDLMKYADEEDALSELLRVKTEQKRRLSGHIFSTSGTKMSADSVFDIQIKRLHEYKRQHLNALYIIDKYLEIKSGRCPKVPITTIFGAKAAPAYLVAKDIIHLILCLCELIKQDREVSQYLNVVMVENYNVSWAERLIPACDISEQISLASKEASGTGNMKLMANGAVTLGTEDGANVEIHSLVGDENIYIFGMESSTVLERYKTKSYTPCEYYGKNPRITRAVDFITSDVLCRIGDREKLSRLKAELTKKDYFMALPDFEDYVSTKDRMLADYNNRMAWAKKMLINIAKSGYFSSDRAVMEYNRDIWHVPFVNQR